MTQTATGPVDTDLTPWTGWALTTIDAEGTPVACLETPAGLFRLGPSLARAGAPGMHTTADLFSTGGLDGDLLDRAAAAVADQDRVRPGRRLAPILYPGKVACAGANYFDHLQEMGITGATKQNQRLFFFTKPARQAVVGEGHTVHLPIGTQQFDWEIELAVVIGRTARAVTPEDAMGHIGGYTVAIDFSARDHNQAPGTFYKLDWFAGKGHDTCCPLGPRIVSPVSIGDPQNLRLRLWVNGRLEQDGNSSDMVFPIAEQIATLSAITTLEPGDILLTGTPAGVGMPRGTFLSVGDQVDAQIDRIGKLTVTIQEPQ